MKYYFLLTLFWLSTLSKTNAQEARIGFMQQGRASYYADNRGGATARSGENYEMTAMEGAHKTLPFGTLVKVTNLDNQKQTLVRINDRPYSDERIMDFTKAVADSLQFHQTVVDIRLEVVAFNINRETREAMRYNGNAPPRKQPKPQEKHKPEEKPKIVEQKPQPKQEQPKKVKPFAEVGTYSLEGAIQKATGYGVQICAFGQIDKTMQQAMQLQKLKLAKVYIQVANANGKMSYKAIAGDFKTEDDAKKLVEKIKAKGFDAFVKKHL